jgi:hypothetical protein
VAATAVAITVATNFSVLLFMACLSQPDHVLLSHALAQSASSHERVGASLRRAVPGNR